MKVPIHKSPRDSLVATNFGIVTKVVKEKVMAKVESKKVDPVVAHQQEGGVWRRARPG